MKVSRRKFLTDTALLGSVLVFPSTLSAVERPSLFIPPLLEVGRGRPVRLDFRATQAQFEAGKRAEVWGVNGQYLGPTVRVKSGEFVKLSYNNSLPLPLSVNIQGLLAPTEMVGSIHRHLTKGESWSPVLNIQQSACTCFYHANTMLNSALPIYRGVVGMWIIEDSESKGLPHRYGIDDIPLILQDQRIDHQGKQVIDTQAEQFFGNRLFVNGKENPSMEFARGWVRLRLLNASLSRRYELRLDNDQPLYLIATGMGFLAEPLALAQLALSPGERAEVLVNLNEGQVVSLISGEKRGGFYQVEQWFQSENSLRDNVVLEMRPVGLSSALENKPRLPTLDLASFHLSIAEERRLSLRPKERLINGQLFDPARIDIRAKLGTVERWYLSSNESIGFNIQGAKFVLETRARQSEPLENLAWRDTVWLEKDQEVTILVKFEHQTLENQPFTFGVADFWLRDKGAMGQLSVVSA